MPEGQPDASPRVIVVGGGVAGLTAAYALSKRGLAVQVLEREAVPGGRMRSERHGRPPGLLDFSHPEKAAPLDSENAADYVRRMFGPEVLDYLVEPAFASTFTVLPENLSKAFLLTTVSTMFAGFRLQAFRGGNGALTQALSAKVTVRLNVEVGRVGTAADAVA